MDLELARTLAAPGTTKVVMVVVSGLGGLHKHETLRSELERADIPNLDKLAVKSEAGLTVPVAPGVTPTSEAGCLALLGYDPLTVRVSLDESAGTCALTANGATAPSLERTWGIRAAVVAAGSGAPLARAATAAGARLVPVAPEGDALERAIQAVRERWDAFDFFVVGFDKPGLAGASGDFELKATTLHELDSHIPELLGLGADVLVVAGDRSTPALLGRDSWHPVPFLIHSEVCREGNAQHFNEQECLKGSLGIFPAVDVLPLIMAHAQRLQSFGG